MDKRRFCKDIGLTPLAIESIEKYPLSHTDYIRWENLFFNNRELFMEQLHRREDRSTLFLSLATELAWNLLSVYTSQGIPKKICIDTFRDIAIWQDDHTTKTGTIGLSQYHWIGKILGMEVIRIGRLEFEPLSSVPKEIQDLNLNFPHTNCYSVHIPADGSLAHEECVKSYRLGAEFFKEQSPLFFCQSWLLSPPLHKLLPATSNILRFQGDYHMFHIDTTSRQAEERLFGTPLDSPELYQATSSLQKRAKQWLLERNTLPSGWGVVNQDIFQKK